MLEEYHTKIVVVLKLIGIMIIIFDCATRFDSLCFLGYSCHIMIVVSIVCKDV